MNDDMFRMIVVGWLTVLSCCLRRASIKQPWKECLK